MPTKETKRIGSGLTDQLVEQQMLDPDNPDDAAEMVAWLTSIPDRLNSPWSFHAKAVAGVRVRLKQVKESLSHLERCSGEYKSHFVERASTAWYLREIDDTARLVEWAVEGNRPWEAVGRAIEVGALLTELRLKFEWDDDAVWGRQQRSNLREQAARSRKSAAADRIGRVDELVTQGVKTTAALAIAAEEFGVSVGAIKKDYYSPKKRSTSGE